MMADMPADAPTADRAAAPVAGVADALRAGRDSPAGIALVPFVPAGYPTLAATAAALAAVASPGVADVVEVGLPFSDPIADGPTIQAAFHYALTRGLKVADVLGAVASVRGDLAAPLVSMVSYSIMFRYGPARFVADLKAAGFSGLILPDLPPPEAQAVVDAVRGGGLDTVLLIAPTTPPRRREQIVRLCSGFVYYLSVSGTTGERDAVPADVAENVRAIKGMTDVPVCVGFGIGRPSHVASLRGIADGAIVGSALVKRMATAGDDAPAVARAAADFCRELRG